MDLYFKKKENPIDVNFSNIKNKFKDMYSLYPEFQDLILDNRTYNNYYYNEYRRRYMDRNNLKNLNKINFDYVGDNYRLMIDISGVLFTSEISVASYGELCLYYMFCCSCCEKSQYYAVDNIIKNTEIIIKLKQIFAEIEYPWNNENLRENIIFIILLYNIIINNQYH